MGVSSLKKVFMSRRAVSPIIGMVLLLAIIVVGVSFVYFLAIPIITRMQDTAMIRQVENSMLLLGDNVLTVVNEGHGSERVTQFSYGKGMLLIYPENTQIVFQMLKDSSVQDEYDQRLGKVEYSVGTSSDIISPDSKLYVRGWHWNVVNGTQGEPNSDIDRFIIQRIGSAQVKLLLDFRPRLYNHTDSKGNLYVTILIVKLVINPYLGSGVGAGTFGITTKNQDVIVKNYNCTFTDDPLSTFSIRASFPQSGVAEQVFSCWVGTSVNVEFVNVKFVVTEVEVGIL